MSWIRRTFGLDGVDLLIHSGVTFFLMVLVETASVTQDGTGLALIGATSLVVLGIRRRLALKHLPPETTGEVAAERLAEVDARLQEVDQLHYRMQELEERLDFTERLLAQSRAEQPRIGEPR